jgi:hypothetical protein
MKPDVEQAIRELRDGLPGHEVLAQEDPDGGGHVIVEGLDIGPSFVPATAWLGFHLTWSYPDADVYPFFMDPAVKYVGSGEAGNQHPDGNLPTAMTRGATMPGFGRPAIQISRRSNRRDPSTDSALQKLLRVLEFLRSR